jgi:hypothetical protein
VLVVVAFVVVIVVVTGVVVVIVIMIVAHSFRGVQRRENFGGIRRAQRFAFQAHKAPNKLTHRTDGAAPGRYLANPDGELP